MEFTSPLLARHPVKGRCLYPQTLVLYKMLWVWDRAAPEQGASGVTHLVRHQSKMPHSKHCNNLGGKIHKLVIDEVPSGQEPTTKLSRSNKGVRA